MRNRNLVQAQVTVTTGAYDDLLAGSPGINTILEQVTSAMNRTAAERRRRVFGEPRQTDAIEDAGLVALTFEAHTEPA